jgi:hypothetical protein
MCKDFSRLGRLAYESRTMDRVQHRIMKMPYSARATARATFSTWAHELVEPSLARF